MKPMQTKPTILPVCSNGRPWTKIGVATNEDQARRVVKKHLADESLSLIKNYGFELQVWERTALALELNGGPRCWTFSVSKTVRTK